MKQLAIVDIACYPYVAMAPEGGYLLITIQLSSAGASAFKVCLSYVGLPKVV